MKKALTIFIDDEYLLDTICGTFITASEARPCVVNMINTTIPKGTTGIYINQHNPDGDSLEFITEGPLDAREGV